MANVRLIFYILLSLFFHILFINLHPVNLEELFLYAADNLGSKADLEFYFKYQANTLLYSSILHSLSKPLYFIELNALSKLISCSGYIFLGIAIYILRKNSYINLNHDLIFLLIVINPLIWSFGYRGTPDFISLAIGFCGLSFALDKNKILTKFGYIILGLSIALKPHSIIFLIFLILKKIDFSKNIIENIYKNYLNAILVISIPTLFFVGNYIKYDFFLLNDNLQNNHSLSLESIIPNLISYLGILTIFCFPIFFYIVIQDILRKNYLIFKYGFIYILIFLPISLILNFDGEIFLGFLANVIDKRLYIFLLVILSFPPMFYLFKLFNNNKDLEKLIILSSLTFVFLLSLSRPSDRYIIFLIPFIIILFRNELQSKALIFFYLIFNFIIVSIIFLNQYTNSTLTKNIKKSLVEKKIQYNTDLGNLFVHSPVFKNKFGKSQDFKFKLYMYKKKVSIHDECVQIFSFNKCYSIVKIK